MKLMSQNTVVKSKSKLSPKQSVVASNNTFLIDLHFIASFDFYGSMKVDCVVIKPIPICKKQKTGSWIIADMLKRCFTFKDENINH